MVVLLHGGCWLAPYDLGHVAGLAAGLTDLGVATWSVTYRRVGDDGVGHSELVVPDRRAGPAVCRDLLEPFGLPKAERQPFF